MGDCNDQSDAERFSDCPFEELPFDLDLDVHEVKRPIDRFELFQNLFREISDNYKDLQKECADLKAERDARNDQLASKTSLDTEIQRLVTERDTLRIELSQAHQEVEFYSQYDKTSSAELDAYGILARKLWFEEQRAAKLEKGIDELKQQHLGELDWERSIASGLRERIGKLEERARRRKEEGETNTNDIARLIEELRVVTETSQKDLRIADGLYRDAEAALVAEQSEVETLRKSIETLEEEKRSNRERARKKNSSQMWNDRRITSKECLDMVRTTAALVLNDIDRMKQEKAPVDEDELDLIRRYLGGLHSDIHDAEKRGVVKVVSFAERCEQAMEAKRPTGQEEASKVSSGKTDDMRSPLRALAPRSNIPEADTPQTPSKTKTVSSARLLSPRKQVDSPSSALARQHADLQQKHISLKEEYDRLRSRHANDVKHWKEYVAVEKAKRERKIERKERRKEMKKKPRSQVLVPPSQEKELAVSGFQEEGDKEESVSVSPRRTLAPQETPWEMYLGNDEQMSSTSTRRPAPSDSRQITSIPAVVSLSDHTSGIEQVALRHHVTAANVTPWLGNESQTALRRMSSLPHDPFEAPNTEVDTPTKFQTPLVRDRVGNRPTSLHRKALELSTAPSEKKRKADMEMDGLSSAEKARKLKKLRELPVSERRELYSAYKGKGRYMPPDEVAQRVLDEYEIDPDKNQGNKYQYHDVVRKKDERKKMHGGDCECCQGYYEAIGTLPRFNQGPVWKDDAETHADAKEHQNKVSRHRDTWEKAPTPPGYWQIGFPTTQEVAVQNEKADTMDKEKEAKIRRDAAHKDSKWRKKN
ncbi:hypothetical protein P7C73_g4625, partial [Tremellales sp. Uapishka_1]